MWILPLWAGASQVEWFCDAEPRDHANQLNRQQRGFCSLNLKHDFTPCGHALAVKDFDSALQEVYSGEALKIGNRHGVVMARLASLGSRQHPAPRKSRSWISAWKILILAIDLGFCVGLYIILSAHTTLI